MSNKAMFLAAALALAAAPVFADDMGDKAHDTTQKAESSAKTGAQKTGNAVSDSWITTKVKAEFAKAEALPAHSIKVETTNGVVTLSGQVDSQQQIDRASEMAKTVKGVQDVHNTLTLKEAAK